MSYCNLHSHSSIGSTMDGMSDVESLAKRAVEIGSPAQALTDHGRMSGVVRLYKSCQEYGLLPLIGTEAYVKHDDIERPSHLVMIAGNTEGLRNLYKLSSLAFSNPEGRRPCLTHQMIEDHNAGIICLSACMGSELGRFIIDDNLDAAQRLVRYYKQVFNDRYYLELQNQNAGKIDEVQVKIAKSTLRLGIDENIKVVATNDSHYTCSSDKYLHAIMMAAGDKEGMLEAYKADLSLLDRGDFKNKLEVGLDIDASEYIDNTLAVVDMAKDMGAGEINPLRSSIAMPSFNTKDTKFTKYGEVAEKIIREYCYEEIEKKFPRKQWSTRKERLETELDVIVSKNFCDYFLIVADYVDFCKRKGYIVGPGRGSGASSLVSYLLGITEVDPQRYGLLFERMLNAGRPDNEPPDFDIDFSPEVRETLIGYLCHKYGDDHVIRVGTFNTLQLKGIIRELGRNLEVDLTLVNAFCKAIPFEVKDLSELKELNAHGEYVYPNVQEYLSHEELKTVILRADEMSNKKVVKSEGLHAAGVIISNDPIKDWCPTRITRTQEGALVQVTQFDMDDLSDIGLIKFDLLKLSAITAITEACKLIKERHNVEAELEHIPIDIANNKNVYRLYHEGRTRGIFQLTGNPSIRQFFVDLKPRNITDIATGISVYRPGLMDYVTSWPSGGTHSAMQEFLKRREDSNRIAPIHPKVDKILKDTQGIVVFQEQIMQLAVDCAGYTLTDADRLRIAVGKKKEDKIQEEKPIFIAGAIDILKSKELANTLWDMIVTFARYGFNKCISFDTPIYNQANGTWETVEDLYLQQKSFNVATLNDKQSISTGLANKIYDNGIQDVYKISLNNGRELKLTNNHKLLTQNGWKELKDISIGDFIACPNLLLEPATAISLPKYKLITLGYLLSEGNLCHPSGVYFYSTQQDEIDDYCLHMKKFKNIEPSFNRSKSATSVYGKRSNKKESNTLFDWIKKLNLTGKTATEKFIPKELFQLDNNSLIVLLAKMFQGDGCLAINNSNNILSCYYATSSKQLATDYSNLLLRLGITSTIHEKQFKYRAGHKVGYTVEIHKSDNIFQFCTLFLPYLLGQKKSVCELFLSRKRNIYSSSFTQIPFELVKDKINSLAKLNKVSIGKLFSLAGLSSRIFASSKNKVLINREILQKLAAQWNNQELLDIANSNIYWGKCKNIKHIGEQQTYDLTVDDTHNYVANGIISHNSHGVSYALISYHTAWLKANYSLEFYIGSINADTHKRDKVAELIEDAKEYKSRAFPKGIEVLPPDITSHEYRSIIENKSIRLGVGIVKGISEKAGEYLHHCSDEQFATAENFFTQIHWQVLKTASICSLITIGSFDKLIENPKLTTHQGRARLLALLTKVGASTLIKDYLKALEKSDFDGATLDEKVGNFIDFKINYFNNRDQSKEGNQRNLKKWQDIKLEYNSKVLTMREILYEEQIQLGFYLSGNPMSEFQHLFNSSTITKLEDVTLKHDGSIITCPVVINEMKVRSPKKGKGNRYALMRIMDSSIQVEGSVSFYGHRNEKDIAIGDILVADMKIDFIQTLEGAETFRVRLNDYRKVGNLSDPVDKNYFITIDIAKDTSNKIFELVNIIENSPVGETEIIVKFEDMKTQLKSVLITPPLNTILSNLTNVTQTEKI